MCFIEAKRFPHLSDVSGFAQVLHWSVALVFLTKVPRCALAGVASTRIVVSNHS